jgi:hypothetical protein
MKEERSRREEGRKVKEEGRKEAKYLRIIFQLRLRRNLFVHGG